MALFKSKDTNLQKSTAHAPKKSLAKDVISSIISQEMEITGEISFSGKARIDGTVEGSIKGEHLILSEGGKIVGEIEVSTFVCHGTFEGNIKANVFTARKTSRINGIIESSSMTVEPGAGLSGEVKVATKDLHLVCDKNSSQDNKSKTASA